MTRKTNAATIKSSGAEAPTTIGNEQETVFSAEAVVITNATAETNESSSASPAPTAKPPRDTKLRAVEALLRRDGGASIADLMTATGWQQHSVRGVLAGTLKRKGLVIASLKVDGVRRYHIAASA